MIIAFVYFGSHTPVVPSNGIFINFSVSRKGYQVSQAIGPRNGFFPFSHPMAFSSIKLLALFFLCEYDFYILSTGRVDEVITIAKKAAVLASFAFLATSGLHPIVMSLTGLRGIKHRPIPHNIEPRELKWVSHKTGLKMVPRQLPHRVNTTFGSTSSLMAVGGLLAGLSCPLAPLVTYRLLKR